MGGVVYITIMMLSRISSFKSSDLPFSSEVDVLKMVYSECVNAMFVAHLLPNVLTNVIILKVRGWSDTKH